MLITYCFLCNLEERDHILLTNQMLQNGQADAWLDGFNQLIGMIFQLYTINSQPYYEMVDFKSIGEFWETFTR